MDFDVSLGPEQPGPTTRFAFDFYPKPENRRIVTEEAFRFGFDGTPRGLIKIEMNATQK